MAASSDAYLLRKNDILTVRSNGNKQLIGRSYFGMQMFQKMRPIRALRSGSALRIADVDPVYLVRYLKSDKARKALIESGDGAQISNLNQQALTALPIRTLET